MWRDVKRCQHKHFGTRPTCFFREVGHEREGCLAARTYRQRRYQTFICARASGNDAKNGSPTGFVLFYSGQNGWQPVGRRDEMRNFYKTPTATCHQKEPFDLRECWVFVYSFCWSIMSSMLWNSPTPAFFSGDTTRREGGTRTGGTRKKLNLRVHPNASSRPRRCNLSLALLF